MSSKDSVTLLCTSIKEGNVSEVRRALASGVDPNSPSSDWGQTRPLILAASSGHPEILEALLAHPDLDPNLPDGMFGNTALIEASHTGHTDVVELLIKDKRTNINFKTERSGMTALMQAARYGHSRVVEVLVEAEPSGVNLQSASGATPLMLVCMAPNQAVLSDGGIMSTMLAVKELDLSIKDDQGKTARDWARDKELFIIEKLILERISSSEKADTDDVANKISDLEKKLKIAEDDNKSLRSNIEEMSKIIKAQEHKIELLSSNQKSR